jgi:Rhodopirellula transposase DDE domain
MDIIVQLRAKYERLQPLLNERQRRAWAATEALALGRGGITRVTEATGLTRMTVRAGIRDLRLQERHPEEALAPGRVRRPGGGRRPLTEKDPTLLRDLEQLIDPVTRGDPQSPLRWTCKSTSKLAAALRSQGHTVSARTVAQLLHDLDYHLQAPRKTREGAQHPDRDAQFEYIASQTRACQRRGQPVVSVDTKKKELVGDFQPKGQEWQPAYEPEEVRVHDFKDPALGKAIPYGVYDVTQDVGWVSVGIDHDTAEFAVAALGQWWQRLGRGRYPRARELLVVADGGGSNGSRNRLWKWGLQQFADATGLRVTVCHFPPGTSKWNKIEHRLFCHITANWRGRPLVSLQVIVSLIGTTRTETGLQVHAALDSKEYPLGVKVTDEEYATMNLRRADFHGDWNYTITPHTS